MEVAFGLQYEKRVVSVDIPHLPSSVRARIKRAIELKLTTCPQDFGKPLRRSLKGYRKLRIGAYRVIFRIEQQTVYIFAIGHRSAVYEMAQKRS